MKQTKIKIIFLALVALFLQLGFLPAIAEAQSTNSSGGAFLCSPSDSGQGDVARCVNNIYRFSIVIASIGAVFMFIVAGYMYMFSGGNDARVATAKSMMTSSVVGIAILLGGLLILRQINPNLLQFKSISPTQIAQENYWVLPDGTVVTGPERPPGGTPLPPRPPGPVTGGGCVAKESGACNRTTISACPAMAAQMDYALMACNKESAGGDPTIASGTDRCTETTTGRVVSFSWGLWQINLLNSATPEFSECSGVLKTAGGPWGSLCLNGTCGRMCTFGSGGEAAFNRCTTALKDPIRNTKQACTLFNSGGWRRWPYTRRVCGLP